MLCCRADDVLKHCRITLEEGNVFTIGSARFEKGLVELVNYYQKNPLYKKMRLRYPINEEVRFFFIHMQACFI